MRGLRPSSTDRKRAIDLVAHSNSVQDVLKHLNVDEKTGLTCHSASERLDEYGENRLKAKKKKTVLQRFFDQFKDVMIVILIIAALISFVVSLYEGEDLFEPALILIIVVLNAIMGVVQESKAEKALEALQKLSAPKARVLRDGSIISIEASLLVPGDIIRLEAGDFIPADARIIESASLKSEESALTGESVPSEKDSESIIAEGAPLGDRHNMLYSGCSITYGRATAVVTATGMNTEMGKIAALLESELDTKTPLQEKLSKLGKSLGLIALFACAVIFVIGLIERMELMSIFMISVSLAVSAIPEGLPAIVTIVLAIGVQRMVKRNAIIRRLPAVETLGSASVICSDKTGTLTQNRMILVKAYDAKTKTTEDISGQNTPAIRNLIQYAALCCDGTVQVEEGKETHIGDPTETAIVLAAYRNGLIKEKLESLYPRVAEIPFDSDRKLMTTVNRIEDRNIVIVKGAFDVLAKRCISGDTLAGANIAEEMSRDALRVLAVAVKDIESVPKIPSEEELENGLEFIGLVGMIDPPRPEAREAVAVCRRAGIKPVMITGDHIVTASAIAKELDIFREGDEAISGSELSTMSVEELSSRVRNVSVYARVSPEDKIRIVKAWQRQGEVVSMTGDGVNDAPALKAADIGCAMGITGTDVAKGASDMILTDDNFATIVDAVREGRGIYNNIKKTVAFLLGTNIGELLTVFFSMMIWSEAPLISVQLLWINLVTDSLPAIALGMEPVERDVMDRSPKPKDEGIFAHGLGVRVLFQGIMFSALTIIGFLTGREYGIETGRTMAFIVLAFTQVVHSFNMRSDRSVFSIGVFTNKYLNGAALISTMLIALVLFVPQVSRAFDLTALTASQYLISVCLAFVPVAVMELSKSVGMIRQGH
ncbi:MAG: Calcium-transporting ATPase 1 [Firmicutes bacterium ADurb.Bin182]|nr:MAG: Calcium-transporting ATPase 1 [Firmicutes bacterium ADurb.Bin182]